MPSNPSDEIPMLNLGQMVERVVSGIQEASGSFLQEGHTLRARLIDDGVIREVPSDMAPPSSMCAVDGGRITKQLYSGDLLVAYATAAEAESSPQAGESFSQQWSAALPHSKDTDKVCGIAMMSLEQSVIQGATHQTRLIDGSFYSPVIEINRTLSIVSPEARRMASDIISNYSLIENLALTWSGEHPYRYIALPKSDSNRDYANFLSRKYDIDIAVNDKVLAAYLLRPGEMLTPRNIEAWNNPAPLMDAGSWRVGGEVACQVATALRPAQQAAREERLMVMYLKGLNPLTAVKIEYFRPESDVEAMDEWVAGCVLNECALSHAQEPAAQYKADVQAKGVATIERQLRELVGAALSANGQEELAALFGHEYRT
jgi:hypothetical protein